MKIFAMHQKFFFYLFCNDKNSKPFLILAINEVPKLVECNYDELINNWNYSKRLWILTGPIEGVRLDRYFSEKSIKFATMIQIISLLIDLVKQIHKQKVVHRNLIPRNIFIHHSSSTENNEIQLTLVDFDLAHIPDKNTYKNHGLRPDGTITNDFYQVPQFELHPLNCNDIDDEFQLIDPNRHSETIDVTFICAIFFWMITLNEPKESRNINGKAPHELEENIQFINNQLKKVAGKI